MSDVASDRAALGDLLPADRQAARGLRVPPNLPDYESVRRAFTWDTARGLLDGLPGGKGLNIAHEAVDRHADRTARAIVRRCAGSAEPAARRDLHLSRPAGGDQPVRQCPAQPRRARRRRRVRAGRPHSRALHRRARRAEGEVRRLAAVLRVRAGADRDAGSASAKAACW